MYSTRIADGHGVLVVEAKMDEAKLLAKAKKAPNHRSMKYRDCEIHTWTHWQGGKDRQFAGAFQDTDMLVLASNADLLKAALDVIDGRSDSLRGADTSLAAEIPAGTMFLARAMGIADSEAAAKHPLCSQLDRLDYAEGQNEGQWFGHLSIAASDKDAGQRIQTCLEAPADLQAAVARHRPGETISLVVYRDDSRQTIKVALGAFGIWEGESEEPVRELLRRLLEGRSPYSEGS